jgi:hypothetical protein
VAFIAKGVSLGDDGKFKWILFATTDIEKTYPPNWCFWIPYTGVALHDECLHYMLSGGVEILSRGVDMPLVMVPNKHISRSHKTYIFRS